VSVYQELRRRLAEEIEERKLSPDREPETVQRLVNEAVQAYQTAAHAGDTQPLRDPADMARRLWHSLAGYGPITDLLDRADVEEIFIEGDRISFIGGSGRLEALMEPTTEAENRQIVDRMLAGTNRRRPSSRPGCSAARRD
jgi:pilus assembly protein CpaF